MNSSILSKIEKSFHEKLEAKTGWGKNDIFQMYKDVVMRVLLSEMDGPEDGMPYLLKPIITSIYEKSPGTTPSEVELLISEWCLDRQRQMNKELFASIRAKSDLSNLFPEDSQLNIKCFAIRDGSDLEKSIPIDESGFRIERR